MTRQWKLTLMLWIALCVALSMSACATKRPPPQVIQVCPAPPKWLMSPPPPLQTIEDARSQKSSPPISESAIEN